MESCSNVNGIESYRNEIDGIDKEVIFSLAKRFEAARKIAAIKRKTAQPVLQPDRRREVEQKYVKRGREYALSEEFMIKLYELIHEETCKMESHVLHSAPAHNSHDGQPL